MPIGKNKNKKPNSYWKRKKKLKLTKSLILYKKEEGKLSSQLYIFEEEATYIIVGGCLMLDWLIRVWLYFEEVHPGERGRWYRRPNHKNKAGIESKKRHLDEIDNGTSLRMVPSFFFFFKFLPKFSVGWQ